MAISYPIKKLSELFLGEWNSSTTYTIGDIVDYNGSSYACIKESINNEPPDTTYWALLANKGDKGEQGEQGIQGEQGEIGIDWQGEWSAGEYTERQAVSHNGSSYVATTTTSQEPPHADWDLIALKGTDGEGTGDVSGPEGATVDNIAVFDGTTGKLIKDGGAKISDKQDTLVSGTNIKTINSQSLLGSGNLGNYLENIVEDTTPELGGNLDAKDKNIIGIGSAGFTQELDNGTKTASFTIDFSTDQKQKVTLTANTMTLTLDTTNVKVGNYILKIVNGGLATLTWASESGSIYWVGKTKPTLTSSGTDIVAFYFDGTNWYGMASLNFGTPA